MKEKQRVLWTAKTPETTFEYSSPTIRGFVLYRSNGSICLNTGCLKIDTHDESVLDELIDILKWVKERKRDLQRSNN